MNEAVLMGSFDIGDVGLCCAVAHSFDGLSVASFLNYSLLQILLSSNLTNVGGLYNF